MVEFTNIVLRPSTEDNLRKNLIGYFKREYLKAKDSQFYESWDFFNSCLSVIRKGESLIEVSYNERVKELRQIKSIRLKGNQPIDDIELEINFQEYQRFSVHISSLYNIGDTKQYIGNIGFSFLMKFKEGILLALKEVQQREYEEILLQESNEWLTEKLIRQKKDIQANPVIHPTEKIDKLITFLNHSTLEKIHKPLKEYFPSNEDELMNALKGEKLKEPLIFPFQQNVFVELFKRIKYNKLLFNSNNEIMYWICVNFKFSYSKGNIKEVRPFNQHTVIDVLKKVEKEPQKNKRILELENFIPFIPLNQRK